MSAMEHKNIALNMSGESNLSNKQVNGTPPYSWDVPSHQNNKFQHIKYSISQQKSTWNQVKPYWATFLVAH